MNRWLLQAAIVAAVALARPSYGQYVYIDVNGDGLNSHNPLNSGAPDDILTAGTYSIDLWYVTNANRDGSAAICATGPEPLTIGSYEATLVATGTGVVAFNSWTDLMGFPTGLVQGGDGTLVSAGGAAWLGRGGSLQPPGAYRVGSLNITVTGSPKLDFVATNPSLDPNAQTAFGSNCLGNLFDGTMRLGDDFFDSDGTSGVNPVVSSTWGKIKRLYSPGGNE